MPGNPPPFDNETDGILLYVEDVPYPVAVSEAVALVRNLSTDDSPSFVNGVLGSMLRDRDSLTP